MALGGGVSNPIVLLIVVSVALVSLTSGLSLKSRDYRCKKAQEGRTVTVLIQNTPVACRCERGIVTDCEIAKRDCHDELKVTVLQFSPNFAIRLTTFGLMTLFNWFWPQRYLSRA